MQSIHGTGQGWGSWLPSCTSSRSSSKPSSAYHEQHCYLRLPRQQTTLCQCVLHYQQAHQRQGQATVAVASSRVSTATRACSPPHIMHLPAEAGLKPEEIRPRRLDLKSNPSMELRLSRELPVLPLVSREEQCERLSLLLGPTYSLSAARHQAVLVSTA